MSAFIRRTSFVKQGNFSPLKFIFGSVPVTWKDICSQGRTVSTVCHLDYIEPEKNSDGKEAAKVKESEN